jgi:hypothetical protein
MRLAPYIPGSVTIDLVQLVNLGQDPVSSRFGWGRVFLIVAHGHGPSNVADAMRELEAYAATHGKVVLVVWVLPTRTGSSPEDRRAMQRAMQRSNDVVGAHCTLISGTGFFASMMLAVSTSIMGLLPSPYPRVMSRTESEAADFTAQQLRRLGAAGSMSDIETMFAEARTALQRERAA